MAILPTLTRMWLTRSLRPFRFTGEAHQHLPYDQCRSLGLYIHIPFCRSICGFCPYCKVPYVKETCDAYLDALMKEIHMVGRQQPGRREVTSLYLGGGTPALAVERLGEVLDAVRDHFVITQGIGVELHPADVTVPVLQALREAGVTKISIGVQSFQEKFQDLLGRPPVDPDRLARALAAVPFETVSMDLIFALPGQTAEDLRRDVDEAFAHGANHVAVYPFIDFTFTNSAIPAMGKREKRALLHAITDHCEGKGYARTSIWTFAKGEEAVYSSMTRETFLGFGCSAATLLRDQFKINTFSVEAYCRRLREGLLPTALTLRFTLRQRMVYYLFWAAYSTQVRAADFQEFFGVPLEKMYGLPLRLARRMGLVTEADGVYTMTAKGAFFYHHYERYYTLAYIDKMWGVLRREAFPGRLTL